MDFLEFNHYFNTVMGDNGLSHLIDEDKSRKL